MGVMEKFLADLKATIIDTLRELIREEIEQQTTDKWLNKKQLAEYWGCSEKWIELHMDEIPHSASKPWSFKRSLADQWRMGELKQIDVVKDNKVSISKYKQNNFKVGV